MCSLTLTMDFKKSEVYQFCLILPWDCATHLPCYSWLSFSLRLTYPNAQWPAVKVLFVKINIEATILVYLCSDLQGWSTLLGDIVHWVQLVHIKIGSTLICKIVFTQSLCTFWHFLVTVYWNPHRIYIVWPDKCLRLHTQRNWLCLCISTMI